MNCVFLGCERKTGTYNDRPYDNVVFYLQPVKAPDPTAYVGLTLLSPTQCKVKFSNLPQVVSDPDGNMVTDLSQLEPFVLSQCTAFFNQYGHLDSLDFS